MTSCDPSFYPMSNMHQQGVRQRLSLVFHLQKHACLKSTSILYLNKILNYLPQFADNCRISFCARHGGTRLQSQHLGTRCRAGVQSWPRLHEILSLKRVSVVNLCKTGKVCVPLSPKYVNELEKDLNPIPFHHAVHGKRPLQYSCKRTDDRYITKISTASCMLSRGIQPRSNSDVRLCTVQKEQ